MKPTNIYTDSIEGNGITELYFTYKLISNRAQIHTNANVSVGRNKRRVYFSEFYGNMPPLVKWSSLTGQTKRPTMEKQNNKAKNLLNEKKALNGR